MHDQNLPQWRILHEYHWQALHEYAQKISTLASTAIPMVNTIPAIPGRVSDDPKMDIMATMIMTLKAKKQYLQSHQMHDKTQSSIKNTNR